MKNFSKIFLLSFLAIIFVFSLANIAFGKEYTKESGDCISNDKETCKMSFYEDSNHCVCKSIDTASNTTSNIASITPKINIACSKYWYPWCKDEPKNPADLIRSIFNYSLILVGVTALGAIIYGGIKYIISAGNPSGQSEATQWITGAIWGLVLLFGAVLLFKEINSQIISLKLENLEPVTVRNTLATPASQTTYSSFGGIGVKDTATTRIFDLGTNYSDERQCEGSGRAVADAQIHGGRGIKFIGVIYDNTGCKAIIKK